MAVRLLYIILGYYCARGVDFIAITDSLTHSLTKICSLLLCPSTYNLLDII